MSNYLPIIVRDILAKTGWNENEVAVYSVLLQKGAMNLTNISYEVSIPISSLQYVLKKLLTKRMISKTSVNDKPLYMVSDVEQLKKWMKGVTKQYLQFEDSIQKFIDQYDFNPQLYTPKVRFFEGIKGIKQSYRAILNECGETEICAMFSVIEEIETELQTFFVEEYVAQRVKQGVKIRNIAVCTPKAIFYKSNDKKNLSETKLVSRDDFPILNTEINLYGDFMHCMSFNEKGAFALIIQDEYMVTFLKAIFQVLWTSLEKNVYMTENLNDLQGTIETRKNLYPPNLEKSWVDAKPIIKKTNENETILTILGHEVMSDYQLPYTKKLAEIVTRNGGDILNMGYGLGIMDDEIEKYRKSRKLRDHYVIELNASLAALASKKKNLKVTSGDWHEVIQNFHGKQFDGILYDGYPLKLEEVHRDGVVFIEKIVQRNLLKENGILTFYVDAVDHFGDQFFKFLTNLGFQYIQTEKVIIKPPKRVRQVWQHDHFLAPILKYRG